MTISTISIHVTLKATAAHSRFAVRCDSCFDYRTLFVEQFLRVAEVAAWGILFSPQNQHTSRNLKVSDNLKRYCAILRHLKQLSPTEPTGNAARHLQTFNAARHLQTLAALVSGIIGSKSCQLPAIASQVPRGASPKGGKRESRSKRFARFLQNKKVTPKTFFLPYAQALVQSLPPGPLVLVMDGSVVGQGCMALMLSVLYDCAAGSGRPLKRALPLCRLVTKAPKGHFTQERHQVHSGASSSSLRSVIKFTQERHQVHSGASSRTAGSGQAPHSRRARSHLYSRRARSHLSR